MGLWGLQFLKEIVNTGVAQNDFVGFIPFTNILENCGVDTIEVSKTTFNCTDLGEQTVTVTVTDIHGNSSQKTAKVTVTAPAGKCEQLIDPKVFILGAALNPNVGEEELMRDDLRVLDLLPTTSPYTDNITTTNAVLTTTTGAKAVVDWVFIELRDENDLNTVVSQQSALLLRDGSIVSHEDAASSVKLKALAGNYYVAIHHRNHLPIVSNAPIALNGTMSTVINYNETNTRGGNGALKLLDNGNYAMYAGDFDNNGQTQNSDVNGVLTELGVAGYSKADMDMNGQVQNTDIGNIITPCIGKGRQF